MCALERLVERETFAAIVARLRPGELMVAALRLEGLSDEQIGQLLGTSRDAVSRRMIRARERIARQLPDAASLLEGRRLPPGPHASSQPLERGWLCPAVPHHPADGVQP